VSTLVSVSGSCASRRLPHAAKSRDPVPQIGFADWNRRDFNAFVRAAEKYGRHALKEIASEIDGKTEEQVHGVAHCPLLVHTDTLQPRLTLTARRNFK